MRRNTKSVSVCAAAAVAALSASHLSAVEIQWRGGNGNISDANYTIDGVDTRSAASMDIINIGTGATIGSPSTPICPTALASAIISRRSHRIPAPPAP